MNKKLPHFTAEIQELVVIFDHFNYCFGIGDGREMLQGYIQKRIEDGHSFDLDKAQIRQWRKDLKHYLKSLDEYEKWKDGK